MELAMAGTKAAWTEERREKQRRQIQETKPWLKSTGPRTPEGKAVSSQNARMPAWQAEANQKLADIRHIALDIFGRKRWPKTPKPKWMRKS